MLLSMWNGKQHIVPYLLKLPYVCFMVAGFERASEFLTVPWFEWVSERASEQEKSTLAKIGWLSDKDNGFSQ